MKINFVILFLCLGSCAVKKKYPITDHYNGKQFYLEGTHADKSFFNILKWSLNRPDAKYPDWIENKFKPELPKKIQSSEVFSTFVNHATFYLQTTNFNFLTDPVFSDRTSPVSFAGPKRVRPVGLTIEEIPEMQFVLISHNHYDHMDMSAIEELHKKFKPVFVVPLGNERYMNHIKEIKIVELDWWQSTTVENKGEKAIITLVPAQHWSARGLDDRRQALWGGFVVQANNQKIFFAGDTGYNDKIFKEIGHRFDGIDLAFLPIGAYEPRWFMKLHHMNPEDAVQVHLDLKAKKSVGMHFGTFRLTDEIWGQPEQDLELAKAKFKVSNFTTQEVGQTVKY